jgi:Pyruvate/2-oxoacid:ferredoxin oxidoreductase delta subunit
VRCLIGTACRPLAELPVDGRQPPDRYVDTLVNHLIPRSSAGQREWLVARYHGKTLTHEDARSLVTLDRPLDVEDLEQIIPFETARRLVLDGPPDIAVIDCACRKARENPCEPLDVCMIVGQPFVDFMLDHNTSARRLTTEDAVQMLTEVHARGHIHSAWFKDVMLGRMYAICNCCTCCCGGLEMMSKYGTMMVAPSGYLSQVDAVGCTGCGICADACPFDALTMDGALPAVNWGACMGCSVCEGQCPETAISMVRDERKGIPLDVRTLAAQGSVAPATMN